MVKYYIEVHGFVSGIKVTGLILKLRSSFYCKGFTVLTFFAQNSNSVEKTLTEQ